MTRNLERVFAGLVVVVHTGHVAIFVGVINVDFQAGYACLADKAIDAEGDWHGRHTAPDHGCELYCFILRDFDSGTRFVVLQGGDLCSFE